MIVVENLTKSFGNQILFDSVSFKINPRERIGLVGRNGHGKTTFFRILIGEEQIESGTITVSRNYRIGHVSQHLEFKESTVLKEGMTGLPESEKEHYWKVEKILAGLGFSPDDMEKHPSEFSGGYQVRLNLAKILVSEPDLLLLDEPTNYLDITSIRWIERFLSNWPHELMLITHDRSFMDKLVTHTVGIHRKKMRKITGNTEKYYSQIAQDEEIYEKTRLNDERRQKEIELFISRFRAKARLANMVQSRVKTLAKLEKKNKLEFVKTLDFSFQNLPFPGKTLMSVENVSFLYSPDTPLIQNLSFILGHRDRLCVVGKNGIGKTTLLKLLSGILNPQSGRIVYHPRAVKGVFEQTNVQNLVDERTVEEEIQYAYEKVDRQIARNICGAMMFEGDSALKKIKVLSGGEKSRVMLGKILVTPVNLLLLDEPTNHLDMESCDSLLSAIDDFAGAVIMVTHNEMFLHALAERLIVFKSEGPCLFEGSYQEFLEKEGWEDEETGPRPSTQKKGKEKARTVENSSKKGTKKELKKKRSAIISERAKILKPIKDHIDRVERDIDAEEKNLQKFNLEMQNVSQSQDGARIADLSRCIHKSQSTINTLFEELERLTHQLENQTAAFDDGLAQIDALDLQSH